MCRPDKRGAFNRAMIIQSQRVLSSGYHGKDKREIMARVDLEAPTVINPQKTSYAGKIKLYARSAVV